MGLVKMCEEVGLEPEQSVQCKEVALALSLAQNPNHYDNNTIQGLLDDVHEWSNSDGEYSSVLPVIGFNSSGYQVDGDVGEVRPMFLCRKRFAILPCAWCSRIMAQLGVWFVSGATVTLAAVRVRLACRSLKC